VEIRRTLKAVAQRGMNDSSGDGVARHTHSTLLRTKNSNEGAKIEVSF